MILLISLLLSAKTATFRITMPNSMKSVLRETSLETGIASDSNIDSVLKEFEQSFKDDLTLLEKVAIYTQSIVWWLLFISAISILFSKIWGYYLAYISTLINLYTSFCYLPFIAGAILPWLVVPTGKILIQLINLLMIFALVQSHRKMINDPNQGMDPTLKTAQNEVNV